MLTRQQIENWQTSHLDQAALQLHAMGRQSEDLFGQHVRNLAAPGGSDWQGQAHDAAQTRGLADMSIVRQQSDVMEQAARIAQRGAADVAGAKTNVLEAIAETEADGFKVGSDLSVTDGRPPSDDNRERSNREKLGRQHAEFIRFRAAQLEEADTQVGRQLKEKAGELRGIKFDGGTVRMLDDGHGGQPAPTNPSSALGLPDYPHGTLSNDETRTVYTRGELKMKELDAQWAKQGVPVEERAKRMFEMRNSLRGWTRELMSDRSAAEVLKANEKSMTWQQALDKAASRGYTGENAYRYLIDAATRSRGSVNAGLGIDPANPPPLPPVRGGGGGLPATAPGSIPDKEPPPGGAMPVAPGSIPSQAHLGPNDTVHIDGPLGTEREVFGEEPGER
ncbi:hypothetical protein [Mycobacteroides abscessus]|uniref:hypothetical protein n=1 Tax=Mycobacteroides abscessus TaxID=36809 RepID=UPI0002683EB0|nr:hypothetical protein [Mycobacteroides abscessus]EIV26808.1 hypothetical protein MA3A0119R_1609 [Mycobacteroides abscessus 3A-0119-R]EIV34281.1 hypothetical protein MA3A0122R_1639 [Mycobacteroides abscessus 3A-0122-R]EIV40241.1 hypothetical protein MA3A0122S_1162 [Mycobacteroides abscessus 3A-0122-S]EIV41056.1 hypothetical protein MA3A0731_1572 [Mycobacteroides abscessus 3A-0731]EIV55906.1 hypothetical protein MA3A0930S_1256 [Mycobacteroides abscessus 3A-0930-S]